MLQQALQLVVPELVLDEYRQNEEENAEKHETAQVLSNQVPIERVFKYIFACNHNAYCISRNSTLNKTFSHTLLANTHEAVFHMWSS